MLITGTSDKIQFRLGSTAATELPFTVDYNNYTSTSVTTKTNNGTSNDTIAVDLVPSPSSGEQNELRYCSIYNADSASETVIIQVFDGVNTRIVFRAILASGDTLQYQLEKGWEVIDNVGNKKVFGSQAFSSSMRFSRGWKPVTTGNTFTFTSQVPLIIPIGRADKSYSNIDISFIVTTSPSGVTWVEAAIYNGVFNVPEVANIYNKRAGVVNLASIVNTPGRKKVSIPVSGINPGDILKLVIGGVWSVTAMTVRTFSNLTVDISENGFGSFTGQSNSARLSGNNYFYLGAISSGFMHIAWQGT